MTRRAVLLVLLAMHGGAAAASTPEDAAEEATHPFFTNTLQLQPAYIDLRAGGSATQLLIRLGLAYHGLFLPGVRVGDTYTFARLEMYGESLNATSSPNAVGLQDWNALWLGVVRLHWGAQLGLGVDAVLPTATNPALGDQEFQLGPAAGAVVTHVRHLQIGALVQVFFSVAGTKPDLGYVLVQPVIAYHLPCAFFFKTDGIMNFNWQASPHATVPVNLQFGHAFTSHVVLSAIVEVVTTGSGDGNVTVQLNLNYLAW